MVATVPKGTERCVRRATEDFWRAPADIELPINTTRFRRLIGYGERDVIRHSPEPGLSTYSLGCAVTGCECSVEVVARDEVVTPISIRADSMETCRRT